MPHRLVMDPGFLVTLNTIGLSASNPPYAKLETRAKALLAE